MCTHAFPSEKVPNKRTGSYIHFRKPKLLATTRHPEICFSLLASKLFCLQKGFICAALLTFDKDKRSSEDVEPRALPSHILHGCRSQNRTTATCFKRWLRLQKCLTLFLTISVLLIHAGDANSRIALWIECPERALRLDKLYSHPLPLPSWVRSSPPNIVHTFTHPLRHISHYCHHAQPPTLSRTRT